MTYPIMLAHGIARFDAFLAEPEKYWDGIPSLLQEHGYQVRMAAVSWIGSVSTRANELARQVIEYRQSTGARKINIIAHSMGGLDARYAIARYGLADKVATLVTLGTPHLGTPVADFLGSMLLGHLVAPVLQKLGIDAGGLDDLTTESCERRNRDLADFEEAGRGGVDYLTYAGVQNIDDMFPPLRLTYGLIPMPNDGLVSRDSAKWKEELFTGEVPFDHFNFLGYRDDLVSGGKASIFQEEVHDFYLSVVEDLP